MDSSFRSTFSLSLEDIGIKWTLCNRNIGDHGVNMRLFPRRPLKYLNAHQHCYVAPRWNTQLPATLLPPAHAPTRAKRHSTAWSSNLDDQLYEIPPSRLESKTHPLGWETIQAHVEPYFSENWDFASEKERHGFFALGFSRAFSQFFPLTLNNRVEVTCKMHYLALLMDGEFHT